MQETLSIQRLINKERYDNYLAELKDEAFRNRIFDYIEKKDSQLSVKIIEKGSFLSKGVTSQTYFFCSIRNH